MAAVEPARTLTNTGLQNLWHRLVSIADECWAATYRGAFSTIVGEALDVGCELLDARGESLAHATRSIPVFNMIMPNTVRAILDRYEPSAIAEGDVFVTNDPWLCAGHLPDVAVVTPVVRDGRLLGFVANVVNVSDIGGNLDRPRNRELFDEGLQIPIVRLCARHRRVEEVWELILRNVRTP
jgi:N-methylhydantoinase B/oxoprolinase/acetone carboxylase alpha subunit